LTATWFHAEKNLVFGYGGGLAGEMDGFLDLLYARPLREKLKAGVRSAGALWRKKL